jgi:hypothetical protein
MNVNEMFRSRYISGADLNGKTWTLAIREVVGERMFDARAKMQVQKYVLYFERARKGVVLNCTMAEQIAAALESEETGTWMGQKISLYAETVTAFGAQHVVVRFRPAPNGVSEPPAAMKQPQPEAEEEPF